MVSVRATGPGDWELVRDVRLAALRDAPDAFASTYEREAAYTEEQWRGWFSDRFAMFLAHLQDRTEPAGLTGVFDAGDGPAWCRCGCGRTRGAAGSARR